MLHGSSSCVPPEESLPGSGRLLELLYLRAATSRCSPPSMATDDNGPAGCDWRDDERSRCRSPIEVWERSHLESLGPRIRALRQDAGLSQATLGAATELSRTSIERVELGLRRTRRSTLERIVAVLVAEPARQGALDELLALAGPAIAEESKFAARVARRRARRARRQRAHSHASSWDPLLTDRSIDEFELLERNLPTSRRRSVRDLAADWELVAKTDAVLLRVARRLRDRVEGDRGRQARAFGARA